MVKKFSIFPTFAVAAGLFLSTFQVPAAAGRGGVAKAAETQSGKTSRIMLVLDNSPSMCNESTGCSGATRNDPTNKRIDGANAFVDSLAARCPPCELGLVLYTGIGLSLDGRGTIQKVSAPRSLSDTAAVALLHSAVNSGRCTARMAKADGMTNLAKRAFTHTGLALDSAIALIDQGFDSSKGLDRQIILLTDGDWQRPTANEIVTAYADSFPGRKLPVIHGIFISDSASHVAYGFPPYGLAECSTQRDTSGTRDTTKVPVDLSHLQLATGATGGRFFPNSTPQTIVATFDSLVHLFGGTPATRAGYKPFPSGEKQVAVSGVALFDPSGRLLKKNAPSVSRKGPFDFQGIYFVKYQDGRVERRMNLPRYGNCGR